MKSRRSEENLGYILGVERLQGEDDISYRSRLNRRSLPTTAGSLRAIDEAVSIVIYDVKPVVATSAMVKRELAIRWLWLERPKKFKDRFVWYLRLWRAIRRK